jgi:PAB1-binding protein PBP1
MIHLKFIHFSEISKSKEDENAKACIHTYRTSSGDRDHRRTGSAATASCSTGPRGRTTITVQEQFEAAWIGARKLH